MISTFAQSKLQISETYLCDNSLLKTVVHYVIPKTKIFWLKIKFDFFYRLKVLPKTQLVLYHKEEER